MGSSRSQLLVLAGLLLVLATVWWWQGAGDDAPARPAAAIAAPTAPAGALRADVAKNVPKVAIARLTGAAVEPNDTGRDPFRFAGAQPGRASGPGGRGGAGAKPVAPPPPAMPPAAAQPMEPAGPPPPPPIPYKLIGVVSSKVNKGRVALLSDGRGVYYGTEGSIIEGRYRILRIGADSIDMVYLDGRGRQTIPLSGA